MCAFKQKKTLSWNGGPLCKDMNSLPLQSHAAGQLYPFFKLLAFMSSLTALDPTSFLPLIPTRTMWPYFFYKWKTTLAHQSFSWSDMLPCQVCLLASGKGALADKGTLFLCTSVSLIPSPDVLALPCLAHVELCGAETCPPPPRAPASPPQSGPGYSVYLQLPRRMNLP